MKKSIRVALCLLVCAALVFCLAACGGGSEGEGKLIITVADASEANPNVGTGAWLYARQQQFALDHPEAEIIHINNPSGDVSRNVQAVVQNLQAGAAAATLLPMNASHYARTVNSTDMIVDWNDYLTEEDLAAFDSNTLNSFISRGKLTAFPGNLGVPMMAFSIDAIKTALKSKGYTTDAALQAKLTEVYAEIDAIVTWNDFKTVIAGLSTASIHGFGGVANDFYLMLGIMNVSNQYTFAKQNADGTMDIKFENQQLMETIDFLQGLRRDGLYKEDVDRDMTTVFNNFAKTGGTYISMIYYPSWQQSFDGMGLRASNIKIINMPKGPSTVAAGEAANSVNTAFCGGWVMNKATTEAQRRLAVEYMQYCYGEDAIDLIIDFAEENDIPMITVPAYNYTDDEITGKLLKNAPASWKTPILNAVRDNYTIELDSDGFISYAITGLPVLISDYNAYKIGDGTLAAALREVDATVNGSFLEQYNRQALAR